MSKAEFNIVSLAEHSQYIDIVVAYLYARWSSIVGRDIEEVRSWFLPQLGEEINNSDHPYQIQQTFIATLSNKTKTVPVGMASVAQMNQSMKEKVAHIANINENDAMLFSVFTNEAYRGKGFGNKLVERSEEYAQQNNAKNMVLDSSTEGLKLYQNRQYIPIRNSSGQHSMTMYKPL